jgi:hypothetical protein
MRQHGPCQTVPKTPKPPPATAAAAALETNQHPPPPPRTLSQLLPFFSQKVYLSLLSVSLTVLFSSSPQIPTFKSSPITPSTHQIGWDRAVQDNGNALVPLDNISKHAADVVKVWQPARHRTATLNPSLERVAHDHQGAAMMLRTCPRPPCHGRVRQTRSASCGGCSSPRQPVYAG